MFAGNVRQHCSPTCLTHYYCNYSPRLTVFKQFHFIVCFFNLKKKKIDSVLIKNNMLVKIRERDVEATQLVFLLI